MVFPPFCSSNAQRQEENTKFEFQLPASKESQHVTKFLNKYGNVEWAQNRGLLKTKFAFCIHKEQIDKTQLHLRKELLLKPKKILLTTK